MKKSFILLSILFFSVTGAAKTTVLYAENAREVMQSLAAAGFKVHNLDQDWTRVTLNIKTKKINCHWPKTQFPDDWISSVKCRTEAAQELQNPITLMQTLKPYAAVNSNLLEAHLHVESIECYLTTPKDPDEYKSYMCVINTEAGL